MRILRNLLGRRARAETPERRAAPRRRTRLRPGKVLDVDLAFLGDCAILDRSAGGVRVRLFADAGAADAPVALFDDEVGDIRHGRVVWRRESEAGIRLDATAAPADPALLRRLRGPYYAIRD